MNCITVDRGRRRVNDGEELLPDRGLQKALGRVDVVLRVNGELGTPARPHSGLGGEVKNDVCFGEPPAQIKGLQGAFDEAETVGSQK